MIPSCPRCGAEEIFDREIPGAYKRYQTLFRFGVGLIMLALAGIVLLAVTKYAIVVIVLSIVGATLFLVKAKNVKVAEMYCKKCDWLEKR